MISAAQLIAQRHATTAEALAAFDALPAIDSLEFVFGRWRGSGLHSDHPMDGLLENYAWYGKEFLSADEVHPLVFRASGSRGDGSPKLYRVNPALMPMGLALRLAFLKRPFMRALFWLGRPLFSTTKTGARLRLIEHRGKLSATMAYDALPIHDVFRKVDDNTTFGLMDYKGMQQPFFFVLRRDL